MQTNPHSRRRAPASLEAQWKNHDGWDTQRIVMRARPVRPIK
jgi:hypothetical protein